MKALRRRNLIGLAVFGVLLSAWALVSIFVNNGKWSTASPEAVNMDMKMIQALNDHLDDPHTHIRSVVLIKDNKLIYQKYRDNFNKNSLFVVNSATKTVTGTLIAIAIKEGFIEGIDEPVAQYFPEYQNDITDVGFEKITIEHLLTMTAGFPWEFTDMKLWVDADKKTYNYEGEVGKNPIQYAFALPLTEEPGQVFNYTTLGSQLLSGIITKTTGKSAFEFAKKYLFKPLKIKDVKWLSDLQGNSLGGFELYLKASDMAKIGQLYLNNGRWDDKQILPKWWVETATAAHTDGGSPHGEKYGYHCWVTELLGYSAFFAGGHGGQFIHVVPKLNLVTVITSDIDQHREYHRDIIGEFVIPAILQQP